MQTYSDLFRRPNPFAFSVTSAFLKVNGVEALEWEPETIRLEVKGDFGVNPAQVVMDKLQAGLALLTTNQYYTYWEPFEEVCHVMNGYEANFEIMRPATVEEMAWSVIETHLIDDEADPLSELFSPEVKGYIATLLLENGFYTSPEALRFIDLTSGRRNPEKEYPELADEIADRHKIRHLRVQAHCMLQYEKLLKEVRQFFPEASLPETLPQLLATMRWK